MNREYRRGQNIWSNITLYLILKWICFMLHVPIIVWYISKRWATSLKYNHGCLGKYVNTPQNKNEMKSVISNGANSSQVFPGLESRPVYKVRTVFSVDLNDSFPIRSRISRRLFCVGWDFELILFDFGSFFEFLICISSI